MFRQTVVGNNWLWTSSDATQPWSRNPDDPGNDQFAILDQLGSFQGLDGRWRFKLRYEKPSDSSFDDTRYNEWSQDFNPVDTSCSTRSTNPPLVRLHIDYEHNSFVGMHRTCHNGRCEQWRARLRMRACPSQHEDAMRLRAGLRVTHRHWIHAVRWMSLKFPHANSRVPPPALPRFAHSLSRPDGRLPILELVVLRRPDLQHQPPRAVSHVCHQDRAVRLCRDIAALATFSAPPPSQTALEASKAAALATAAFASVTASFAFDALATAAAVRATGGVGAHFPPDTFGDLFGHLMALAIRHDVVPQLRQRSLAAVRHP